MPMSRQQILDNADKLADRFEADDFPDLAVPVPNELWDALRAAVVSAASADRALAANVRALRARNVPWRAIGGMLGVSGEAARRRFAKAS